MYDMLIIGGGAAGLAAASYAHEHGLGAVLLCEQLGGKAGTFMHSDDHRSLHHEPRARMPGDELVRMLANPLLAQPERILVDRVISIRQTEQLFHVVTEAQGVLETRTVIVATGASPRHLHVPGAERFVSHGFSYSIKTFAHLVAGQKVAVVGATHRVLRGITELLRRDLFVHWIVPDPEALATPIARVLRQHPRLEVLEAHEVRELVGLQHLEEVLVGSGTGPRRLNVSAMFVDLGLEPNSGIVRNLVATNSVGFVEVNEHQATTVPGIFAAGDVTTHACEQVMVAVGDGARAAMNAYDYVLAQWLAARS
jgi:thioredoxin reductase